MGTAARNGVWGLLLAAAGCGAGPGPDAVLRMSTTTSLDHSGLLEVLLPAFERRHGVRVHVVAVGTGKALKLGENGDVDVVLVHDPESEDRFLAEGHGVARREVMVNDFVLAGPAADPAGVKGLKDAAEAMRRIAAARAVFVSRGDDSGTHKKERALWKAAGVVPRGGWYLEAGQGMGPVLRMAAERRGYCLADRGTLLAARDREDLEVLLEGDPRLLNPYSVIPVHPARHPRARYREARMLAEWLVSAEGQELIGRYTRDGRALFIPSALRSAPR